MNASGLSRKFYLKDAFQNGSRNSLTVCYLPVLFMMLRGREGLLPSATVSFLLTIISLVVAYSIHFDEVVPGSRKADSPFCSPVRGVH